MKLKDYLKEKHLSIADFAAEIGLTYAAVRQYVNAGRVPKPSVMVRIIEKTNGKVRPSDFYAETKTKQED